MIHVRLRGGDAAAAARPSTAQVKTKLDPLTLRHAIAWTSVNEEHLDEQDPRSADAR